MLIKLYVQLVAFRLLVELLMLHVVDPIVIQSIFQYTLSNYMCSELLGQTK